jgi:hypothetical protein
VKFKEKWIYLCLGALSLCAISCTPNGPTPILEPVEPPLPPHHYRPRPLPTPTPLPTAVPTPEPTPKPTPVPTPLPTPKPFVKHDPLLIIGLGAGLDWPFSGWNPSYSLGTGGSLEVGYAFFKDLEFGVNADYFSYSGSFFGTPLTDQDLRVHFWGRYFWGQWPIRPYLTAEGGEVWESFQVGGNSLHSQYPTGGLGGGMELGLDKGVDLYVQALFSFLFSPGVTAIDIPFTTGLRFKL